MNSEPAARALSSIVLVISTATFAAAQDSAVGGRFEPNWESLDTCPMPEWSNEAKFGFFVVWGPYGVSGFSEPQPSASWPSPSTASLVQRTTEVPAEGADPAEGPVRRPQ